jgi:phage portal protein BeeE
MGLFRKTDATIKNKSQLEAQYAPSIMGENLNSIISMVLPRVSRNAAMSVPSIARCRNLLSSVVADLPLNLYRNSTGEELGNPLWVDQPAINQPRSVTMAWTVDSLLMYGVAYWQVTEVYAEDGRPSRFQWIPNVKVTFTTDLYGTTVTQYFIDAVAVPMSVPSIARCRNLLASVVADLPLNLYRNSTGEELGNPLWCDQPAIISHAL